METSIGLSATLNAPALAQYFYQHRRVGLDGRNEADLRLVFDPAAPVPLHPGMVVELASNIELIEGAITVPEEVTIRGRSARPSGTP